MTNNELSQSFRAEVPELQPLDYFDRFVELCVYLNETLLSGDEKDNLLISMKASMVNAYHIRHPEEEVNDE